MTDQASFMTPEERVRMRNPQALAWLDKARARYGKPQAAPAVLYTEACDRFSVYLWRKDGSLWTINGKGERYKQVRPAGKAIPQHLYLCLHCKQHWLTYDEAIKHYE